MHEHTIWIDGSPFVSFNGELRPVPRGGADDETPNPDPVPDEDTEGEGEGGDDDAEPEASIPTLPEDLTSASDEDLRALHADLQEHRDRRREGATSAADIAAIQSIVDRQNAIAAELVRRHDEAIEVATALEALDATLPTALPDAEPALAGAGATAAQLASARQPQSPAAQVPPTPAPTRPRVALLASAATDHVPVGSEISWSELGAAYDAAKRKAGPRAILANLPPFMPGQDGIPDLLSTDNGAPRNRAMIDEAVDDWRMRLPEGDPARLASAPARQGAAVCEPFDIIREIPDAFSSAEPVRDIFPARPASRLGFQFVRSIGLADVVAGVTDWTDADQAAIDEDDSATWKPCVDIDCPDVLTSALQIVTACLTFPITLEMSAPERVRNFTNALNAQRARVKEGKILGRIDALSHSYRFHPDLGMGALPSIIEALNTVLAQLDFADRQNEASYVLIVPPAVEEILYIDRAKRGYNNDARDDVLGYLRDNVPGVSRVVDSLDATLGGGGEPGLPFPGLTPITDPPTPVTVPYISGGTYRFRLVEPSAAIYSETGDLNLGTTRDSRLIRMNRSQYFVEEFFFLEKHGPQPWATIDVDMCGSGGRAGLIEPDDCRTS